MKPLNLDNSPCSPISSNCVIWQGPDIACIKLCKGDTISDVTHKLATELCTIMDTLNISNYDLSCFNLGACPPEDFQALINFLITKICELENITPPAPGESGGCPDNCRVTVPECLGGGISTLTNYVQTIATRLCQIVDEIAVINLTLEGLRTDVDYLLDQFPIPTPVVPGDVTTTCTIGSLAPGTYAVDVLLDEFTNQVWCDFYNATGTTGELIGAIAAQCVGTTDLTLQFKYSNPTQTMGAQYGGAGFTNATTVAEAIQSLWIALCDTRGRELMEYEVTTTDDITVSTSVVGAMTTFEIGRPAKVYYYDAVTSTIDLTVQPGFVSMTYFIPPAYAGLAYTNTTGATKDFLVRVSYDTKSEFDTVSGYPQPTISNWVDGAITKNGSTVLYESLGYSRFGVALIDSTTNTVINSVTTETVVTTPSGHAVDVSIEDFSIVPRNTSFFTVVSLLNGESVQLQFKGRSGDTATLLQAQFFIEEIR